VTGIDPSPIASAACTNFATGSAGSTPARSTRKRRNCAKLPERRTHAQPLDRISFLLIKKELLTKRLSFLVLFAACAAAIFATGCGGGDGGGVSGGGARTYSVVASTTMTGTAISKARFVERVNGICRHAWPVLVKNLEQVRKRRGLTASIRLSLLAGIDFEIFDKIRTLGAPEGEERAIEEIIGPMQYTVERNQKHARLHSVAQVVRAFADYNRRARAYGLEECLVDRSHLAGI